MKYRVKPTKVQWFMIAGTALVILGLLLIAVYEIPGILSEAKEDTLTEWVTDLHWAIVLGFSVVSGAVAILLGWFSIHVWEYWVARRQRERELASGEDE